MLDVKTKQVVDGTIAAFHSSFDFFFQVCGGLTDPRDLQMFCTLFRTESLKGEELRNFLGDMSIDNAFKVAIVQQIFF